MEMVECLVRTGSLVVYNEDYKSLMVTVVDAIANATGIIHMLSQ